MAAAANQSCLIGKLGHYLELMPRDEALLAACEGEELEFRKRNIVRREGEEIDYLFVVQTGWFYGFTLLPSGKRQVHRIFFPGDFIGTHEIVCTSATYDITAASSGVLCRFDKSCMRDIFLSSPRLTALIYSLEALEQISQDDRLRAIARMDAEGRLAHFFLQIFSRIRITEPEIGNSLRLEMSQELIGDALGLTGIHVNRTLKAMTKAGLIELEGSQLTLLDEKQLKALSDFDDRHYQIDIGWFPEL